MGNHKQQTNKPLTIASKVQFLVACFSKLNRWLKQKRRAKSFLQKETEFFPNVDELFDVVCCNGDQRKHLQKSHILQMIEEDYAFYEAQRESWVATFLDVVLPSTSLDQMFIWWSDTQLNAPTAAGSRNVVIESHVGNALASDSTASIDSSPSFKASDFLPHLPVNVI